MIHARFLRRLLRCSKLTARLLVKVVAAFMLCLVLDSTFARFSAAVVVVMKPNNSRVYGVLLKQDAQKITVRVVGNAKAVERTISRDDIVEIIFAVSPERLQALRPNRPQEYFNYAQELASKQQDPEARETAIRLYIIAANLDPANFGRKSMLGAVAVARTMSEETKFRAMGFLLDPEHEASTLKRPEVRAVGKGEINNDSRQIVIQASRHLRKGDFPAARRVAERHGVKEAFEPVKGILRYDEFLAACVEKNTSPNLVRKLLAIELALDDVAAGTVPEASDTTKVNVSWSEQLRRSGGTIVAPLDLDHLTEFNPRENIYRNDKWTLN